MRTLCLSLLALLLSSHLLHAQTPERGIADVVALLGQKHGYLVPAEDRARLNELNRVLRDPARRRPAARNPERQRAVAEAAQAALPILERVPGILRAEVRDGTVRLPPLEGITFPGDFGALLFRVAMPGDGMSGVALEHSLAEPEHAWVEIPLGQARGVIWVLLSLTDVPKQKTNLPLNFTWGNGERTRVVLPISTPEPGRLRVTVIDADTAQPGPAMIRLVNLLNRQDVKPANAIEFAPQFDSQGQPSGRRSSLYFGRLRGEYWCVPGPFDMALPAGEWEITVRRGVEHAAIFDQFSVRAGRVTEKTFTPQRWVDMRKQGWFSGDDHVHCRIISDDDARKVMSWVQAEEIHLANIVKMGDIFRTWFEQRGWGPDHRVIERDYILSPGQECPRTHNELGHTLHMNTQSLIRDTDHYFLYDWVFDQVQAQGGLSGYAHVLSDAFHVHRDMSLNVPKGKVDFAEIMQFAQLGTDLYYRFLNAGFKIVASAGSDVPWGGTVGEVRVYSFLGEEPFTADNWFKAFGRGRTFVSNGPMLDFRVDDAYPGDDVVCREPKKLRVRARAWGHKDRVLLRKLEVIAHGRVLQMRDSSAGEAELSLEFEVDSQDGFWIAARAQGTQGESAHTSPIYVVREGLRFWKFDEVPALLDRFNASLDEIDALVRETQDLQRQDKLSQDWTRQQLALQGPALLERVAATRALYQELRRAAEREQTLRHP